MKVLELNQVKQEVLVQVGDKLKWYTFNHDYEKNEKYFIHGKNKIYFKMEAI